MAQQTFNDPSQSGAQQFSGGLIRPGAPQFTPQSMQGSVPQSPSGGSQAANTQPAQQLQQIPRGQPRGPRGAHAQHRAMPAQTYNPYQPQQHMMPYVQQPMYTQPQVSTLPGYPPQYNNAGYIPTTHYAQPRVPAQTQTHSSAPREKKILEIQDPTTGEVLNSKLSELKPGSPSAQANGQPQPHVPGSKAFIPTPAPAPAAAAGSVAATPQAAASPTSIPSEGPSLPQSGASSAYVSPIFGAIANGNAQEFLPAEAPNLDLGLSAVSAEEPPAPAAAGEGGDHSGPIMFGDFGGVGSDEEEAPKKDEDAEKQKAAAEAEEKKKKEEEEAAKLKEELEKAKKEAEEKAKKEVEEKAKKEAEAKAAAEKKKRQEEEAAAAAAKKKAEEEEAERRKQEAEAQKEKERAAAAEAAAKKKAEEEAKKTMKKSKVRKAALEKADSAPAEDGLLDAFTQKPAPVETPKKEPEPEPTLDVGTSDSGPLSWEDAPATPKVPLPSPSPNKMALRPGAGGKKTDKSTSESEKAIFTRAVLFQIRADLGTVERPEDLPEFKIVTTDAGGNGGGGGSFRPGGRQGGGRNNRREGGFNQGQQNHNQGGPNQPGNWQAGGRPQGPPYPDQMGRGGGYQQGGRGGRGFDQRGGGGRGGRGRGRNQPSVPEFTGPVKPLEMTENRWKPTQKGVTSQLDKAKKDVRGILNKMTREKFERLSKQLIEIRMTSSEMLNAVIGLVFDKALDEPNFGDMYADLCVQLHGNSRCWSFVKGILNEDTNQWYWTADVPTEEKALGPLASQEECLAAASQNEEVELANCPAEVEIVALRIRDKMFVKVMQCPDGAFYTVFIPEDEAREQYHISPECFNTEVDALKHAQRKTAFKRFLLNKCQEEFEKEDIYEDLKKQEKEFDWNSLKSEAEKKAKKEDFEEKRFIIKKRMLGNIRFIGELYKKDMLKENIMHDCLNHLLLLDHDKGKKKIVIPDEQDLESLGKLLCTIGKKIDNPKSKDNMERYIQKMLKIKESKGVSARTRFMIQDVVDLRKNHWVPRRQEVQAKTIKQIRKEAEREMGPPQMQQGGRGGRGGRGMPPGGRGGPQMGPGGQPLRQMKSMPAYMQQQGPPGGRGAPNNMPPMIPQQGRGWGAGPPRGSPMMGNRNLAGQPLSRMSQSEHPQYMPRGGPMSGRGTPQRRMSGTMSDGSQTPTPPPMGGTMPGPNGPPVLPARRDFDMEIEVIERKIKVMTDEYLVNKDNKELVECLEELPAPRGYQKCVDLTVSRICDGSDKERDDLVKMLVTLYRAQRLIPEDFENGMLDIFEFLNDMAIDVPKVHTNLGLALGPFLLENCVSVRWVCETARRFDAGVQKIICAALDSMLKHASAEIACNFCRVQQLVPASFCESEEQAFAIMEEKQYWGIFPYMKARQIIPLLEAHASEQECLEWLASNAAHEKSSLPFMQEIMELILQYSTEDQQKPTAYADLLKECCRSLKTQLGVLSGVQNFRKMKNLQPDYVKDMIEFLLDQQIVSVPAVEDWQREFARIDPTVVDLVARLLRS